MILKITQLKRLAKKCKKQIGKDGVKALDFHITTECQQIIAKQKNKRITAKNLVI